MYDLGGPRRHCGLGRSDLEVLQGSRWVLERGGSRIGSLERVRATLVALF